MLTITSPAFGADGPIPRAHTCDGADQSPPLVWSGVPDGTRQLALIVDDPDAPGRTFVHWVLYALPPKTTGLPAGMPRDGTLVKPVAAVQGMNDFRRVGWNGPCPPPGPAHRYVFTLYALDTELKLPPGATSAVVVMAAQQHIREQAQVIGRYGRSQR
jgi:Raf kinase inhibitor-like YbhB/YbcL family protein